MKTARERHPHCAVCGSTENLEAHFPPELGSLQTANPDDYVIFAAGITGRLVDIRCRHPLPPEPSRTVRAMARMHRLTRDYFGDENEIGWRFKVVIEELARGEWGFVPDVLRIPVEVLAAAHGIDDLEATENLEVAHLDHNWMNDQPENLTVLCQAHHKAYDAALPAA